MLLSAVRLNIIDAPLDIMVWRPGGHITDNRMLYQIRTILIQIIPAIFVDILLVCFGRKPLLLRVQRKIIIVLETLHPYVADYYNFATREFKKINGHLNLIDQKIFDTNLSNVSLDINLKNGYTHINLVVFTVHGSGVYDKITCRRPQIYSQTKGWEFTESPETIQRVIVVILYKNIFTR